MIVCSSETPTPERTSNRGCPGRDRGRKPSLNPGPTDIRGARVAAGRAANDAATGLHTTDRAWKQGEEGGRRMDPAVWGLFLIKTTVAATA